MLNWVLHNSYIGTFKDNYIFLGKHKLQKPKINNGLNKL